MRIEQWRITALGFLLTAISLIVEFYFGWPYSHVFTWLLLTLTIACALLIILPFVYGLSGAVVVIMFGLITLHFIPPNETETHGWLTPGNEPIPRDNACASYSAPESIAVLLGDSGIVNRMPFLVALSGCGHALLWIDRGSKGLRVQARIFDGKIVAEIKDNEFILNPNNIFKRERPDAHTLIIYDQLDQKRLSVRFLNPQVVQVTGIFSYPGCNRQAVITENSITTSGWSISASCVGAADDGFTF
jgi:hypothetical protein